MISTNFINECKNRANGNRLGQIVVNGLDNPITQSNNLQSFEIDSWVTIFFYKIPTFLFYNFVENYV